MLKFGIFCAVLVGLSQAGKIPEYIHICKQNDPDVSKCIRESVEVIRPKLKHGIAEIGVPGLEPMHIKKIEIINRDGLKAVLNNVVVEGASAFEITKLKVDVAKSIFRVGIKIPSLKLEGDYDIDAKILNSPIQGNGKFHALINNVEGQGVLKGKIGNHDGHNILEFTSFVLHIRFDDYDINLENLFGGDKVLGQAINDLIKENKSEFLPAAIPFIEKKVSEIILEAANRITKNLNYDEVFPKN